jgi:hypothetical protein
MEYIPQISTGYYPKDAGWVSMQNEENILLLCVPELNHLITFHINNYDYAWLYNQELDAYIFCFRINHKFEHGVIFQKEHAGILLQDDEFASNPFTIAVTDKELENLKEEDSVFMLKDIILKKSKIASW